MEEEGDREASADLCARMMAPVSTHEIPPHRTGASLCSSAALCVLASAAVPHGAVSEGAVGAVTVVRYARSRSLPIDAAGRDAHREWSSDTVDEVGSRAETVS